MVRDIDIASKLARSLALVLLGALAGASHAAPSDSEALAPFRATFDVVFLGVEAGTSTLELTRESDDRWRYESHNRARGLFRLAFPDEILQTSVLQITESGPRPLRYRADDGGESTERDVALDFDWAAGRVRGLAETRPVDLALPAGTHDAMTVQLALILALRRGESPQRYSLIDKTELKTYLYRNEGRARLFTPSGEVDAVIWSSGREGSNRLTRVWYVPAWGYLPAKAERRKGDRIEWTMRLRNLDRQ